MNTLERDTRSEDETIALGAALGRVLRPGDVLALRGELGAGKTHFVRGVATGMGHDPGAVSSPTFVLVNEYESRGAPPLVHVDAYRLRSAADLDALGWDRLTEGSCVVAVEWPERIDGELPHTRLDVSFTHVGEQERRIVFSWRNGAWGVRLGVLVDESRDAT